MTGTTEKDWRTRHLGSVTAHGNGNRLSVQFDPKSGGPVRIEGDIAEDWQAFAMYLPPDQAEDLARWLTEAAAASRAFFAEPAAPHDTRQEAATCPLTE